MACAFLLDFQRESAAMATIGELRGSSKRPRWADLQDSDAESLQVMSLSLSRPQSRDACGEEPSVLDDAESLDGLDQALSQTLSTLRKACPDVEVDDAAKCSGTAAKRRPVGDPLVAAVDPGWQVVVQEGAFSQTPPRKRSLGANDECRHATVMTSGSQETAARASGGASVSSSRLKARRSARAKAAAASTSHKLVETKDLNACDEEWLRRAEKRRAIIAATKEMPAYQARLAAQQGNDAPVSPRTPDPNDRDISKRTWEKLIADWRQSLKEDANLLGSSP